MARKQISVLEINGRRYDAVNGVLLDGPAEPKVLASAVTAPSVSVAVKRQPAAHARAHQPIKSQTLMRRSVHQPVKAVKTLKAQSHTGWLAAVPKVAVAPKLSIQSVHPGRAQRAKIVSKSSAIQHYAAASSTHHIVAPKPTPTPKVVASALAPAAAPKPASHAVFERALAHATAHEAKPYNPRKHARQQRQHARHLKRQAQPWYRRRATLAASSFTVLAITGLVALQYRPTLTLHLANAKAGFSANLPAFRPSGFGYGSFTYQPGLVGIQFKSDDSNRSFSLEQQTSNWDNQTLLVNQVASSSHSYQALKIAGHTVYVYGQNNASWLDHGILYQLNSNGNLSTNDVLNIASSL